MNRRWLVLACGLVAATAGLTVLGLWLGGAAWQDSSDSSFCQELKPWHAKMSEFFIRVNQSGSRTGEGRLVTNEMFMEGAALSLPKAASPDEASLRDTLSRLVTVHEEWLSELGMWDVIVENPSGWTQGQKMEVYQRGETKRIEGNALLRDASAQLEQVCDLPPFEIYSK